MMKMDDDIIRNKVQRAIELICPLYKEKLITDAFIIGSVARGTASEYSDIDIYIVNPEFKKQKYSYDIQLIPGIEENIYTNKIIEHLEGFGVEFKRLSIKNDILWLELYKDEIFHFLFTYDPIHVHPENIRITKDLC